MSSPPPNVLELIDRFERNREVLSTFLRYHHAQGLSPRQLGPEELFARETLESFVI